MFSVRGGSQQHVHEAGASITDCVFCQGGSQQHVHEAGASKLPITDCVFCQGGSQQHVHEAGASHQTVFSVRGAVSDACQGLDAQVEGKHQEGL